MDLHSWPDSGDPGGVSKELLTATADEMLHSKVGPQVDGAVEGLSHTACFCPAVAPRPAAQRGSGRAGSWGMAASTSAEPLCLLPHACRGTQLELHVQWLGADGFA